MKRGIKRLQEPRAGIQYIINQATRQELNPFVFFDAVSMNRNDDGLHIGSHPHSGIGIITYFEGADLIHDDSGLNDSTIPSGGVQWIRAGGGVWHEEHYMKQKNVSTVEWSMTLHQLWMQLPPELEESKVEYQNIHPEQLPLVDNVKVIVGTYKGQSSPLKVPYNMTYLDVKLKAGEKFELDTPSKQTIGFVFPRKGNIAFQNNALTLSHISVLDEQEGLIEINAKDDSAFVILLSAPQKNSIITHSGSIHTTHKALENSLARIQAIKN